MPLAGCAALAQISSLAEPLLRHLQMQIIMAPPPRGCREESAAVLTATCGPGGLLCVSHPPTRGRTWEEELHSVRTCPPRRGRSQGRSASSHSKRGLGIRLASSLLSWAVPLLVS